MKKPDLVYECPLDESTGLFLRLYLYNDVQNIEEIRKNVLNKTWNCAIIKPSLILDPLQIVVAANKAAVSQKDGSMVTRSVYTEILFNLSITKNISQSLAKFGVEKEKTILIAFIDTQASDHSVILNNVLGTPCNISDIAQYSNLKDIKYIYKLDKMDIKNNEIFLDIIISRMSVKSFVSN